MSGGGDGAFEDVIASITPKSLSKKGNFFENFANDYLNSGVQTVTGGLVGFDNGFKGGVTTEFVKELSGAKAAEDANEMAKQQFEEQKNAAEQERNQSIFKKGLEQVQMSQLAGAARRSGNNKSISGGMDILGANEKDFLGL